MRRAILALASVLILAVSAVSAQAQTIRIVVPFPAGGATDAAARVIAEALTASLGETVVVENMPGAEGLIAGRHVVGAVPDARTLIMGGSGTLSAPFVVGENRPDYALFEFAPVCGIARFNVLIAVRSDSPYRTIADLVAAAKSRKGAEAVTMGSGNKAQGVIPNQFEARLGASFRVIPTRGEPAILTNLLGGHIEVGLLTVGAALPSLTAGKLRALAITSPGRSVLLPDVPSVAEALKPPKWVSQTSWVGLLGPAGLERRQAEKIEKACGEALKKPDVAQKLKGLGFEPMEPDAVSAKGFGRFLQAQLLQWFEIAHP